MAFTVLALVARTIWACTESTTAPATKSACLVMNAGAVHGRESSRFPFHGVRVRCPGAGPQPKAARQSGVEDATACTATELRAVLAGNRVPYST